MRAVEFVKVAIVLLVMLILLCTLGCSSIPHLFRTPDVCPTPREKPTQAMQAIPDKLTEVVPTGDSKRDAELLQRTHQADAALYQTCRTSRQALIDWFH